MKMGNKNILMLVAVIVIVVFALSTISSEIIVSQPNSVYSLGDELNFNVKLDSLKSGYLVISLLCPNGFEGIYQNVPETTDVSLVRKLIPDYIKTLSGSCSIKASYAGEEKLTRSFEISDSIEVNLRLADNSKYNAGENIIISGEAVKKNGEKLGSSGTNAFIDVSLGEATSVSDFVKEGVFSVVLKTSETMKAGAYSLDVRVYEKDDKGNILNSGEKTMGLEIKQIPARAEIAIDRVSAKPGETIALIPSLYDRAGDKTEGEVFVKIIDSQQKIMMEKYTPANENLDFSVPLNNSPGKDRILIQKAELSSEKLVEIEELKKIETSINGSYLTVRNVGNVPYSDLFSVKIGNEEVSKEISLGVGQQIIFLLSAPDGVYNIETGDSEAKQEYLSVTLTGGVISVQEIGERTRYLFSNYPIIWAFIAAVLILFVFVLCRRYLQNRKFNFDKSGDRIRHRQIERKGGVEIVRPEIRERKIDESILGSEIRKAEQVSDIHGSKHFVSIIAIKTRGNSGGIIKESLNNSLEQAYNKKAVSFVSGDQIILIFSPLLTKKKENEEDAIKAAVSIDNYLREHNRKFRNDNLSYGIGVNCGELADSIEKGVLKFTNIGRTILDAKKIAAMANNEVLLSKSIREKTMSNVKVDRVNLDRTHGKDVFTIKRVVNQEQNKKFIDSFLRRN